MQITEEHVVPGSVFIYNICSTWKMEVEDVRGDEVSIKENRLENGVWVFCSLAKKSMSSFLNMANRHGDFMEAPHEGEVWSTPYTRFKIFGLEVDSSLEAKVLYMNVKRATGIPARIKLEQFMEDCTRKEN